jgi:hypothetical protein
MVEQKNSTLPKGVPAAARQELSGHDKFMNNPGKIASKVSTENYFDIPRII